MVRISLITLLVSGLLSACTTADLYEKTVAIPGHKWKSSYKPSFTFNIKDTSSSYQLYLVIRHTDKYNFNNIWLNLSVRPPGADSAVTIRVDEKLGSDEKGWFATGMDDIYEHRLDLAGQNISFRKPGEYTFTLEQIMREDPLYHVLNVGLRVEKKP